MSSMTTTGGLSGNKASAPLGIRKIERPRPLGSVSHIGLPGSNMANSSGLNAHRRMSAQDVSTVEEVIQLLETVSANLEARNYEKPVIQLIIRLNNALKIVGSTLELFHREFLDKSQVVLRNACKDTSLDIVARLHLLEIIELRSMKWVLTESVTNYYRQKLSMVDFDERDAFNSLLGQKQSLNVNAPLFTPGFNVGNGGNILDQLLPHQNVSSQIPEGQVMISSVMPGSVDRLVQITGSVPTNVAQAKLLMEDTIRRNQSPTPTLDLTGNHPPAAGSTSAPNQEYKFSVKVGDELVKISSTNLQLVKASKIILDEYFTNNNMKVAVSRQPLFPNSTPEAFKLAEMSVDGAGHSQKRRENFARTAAAAKLGPEKKRYDRQFILKCAQSPYCAALPEKMEKILEEFPEITKKEPIPFDGVTYSRIALTELIPTLLLKLLPQEPNIEEE